MNEVEKDNNYYGETLGAYIKCLNKQVQGCTINKHTSKNIVDRDYLDKVIKKSNINQTIKEYVDNQCQKVCDKLSSKSSLIYGWICPRCSKVLAPNDCRQIERIDVYQVKTT